MFPAPAQEVRGKGKSDQAWINDTVESGVAACHWPRPKARVVARGPVKQGVKQGVKRGVKRAKSGGIWVDAILPVPALPEPEPPAPAPVDLKVNTPPPAPARHWPQTLFDRLDGR